MIRMASLLFVVVLALVWLAVNRVEAANPPRYIRGDLIVRDEITAATATIGNASLTGDDIDDLLSGDGDIGSADDQHTHTDIASVMITAGTITELVAETIKDMNTHRFVWAVPIDTTEFSQPFGFSDRKIKWGILTIAGLRFPYETGRPRAANDPGFTGIIGDHIGAHSGISLTLDYPLSSTATDDNGSTIYIACELICSFEDADIPYGGGDYDWIGAHPSFEPAVVFSRMFGGFGL